MPPVEVLVTRHAAIGCVMTPTALLDAMAGPPTADDASTSGVPAVDGYTLLGSSSVTSICQLELSALARPANEMANGAICQFVNFQGDEPDDVTVTAIGCTVLPPCELARIGVGSQKE